MSFLKKFFGSQDNLEQPKQKTIIPLKGRGKIQVIQTVSGKNYKIVRQDEKVGDRIDHYQYYDDDGRSVSDFTQIIWLFDNMVKSNFVNVPDHI